MDNIAYAWGNYTFGQLGTGLMGHYSTPLPVSSAISWKEIACGDSHTIGIDASTGLVYAWGSNTYGQLGNNSTVNMVTPVSVSSAISWKQIACGNNHTLGIDGATGLAYAWGGNTYGELGTGDLMSYSVPTSVSSTISWKQIICGYLCTLGIDAATGLAYAWGYNYYGQLGTGNRTSYSVPTSVSSTISWSQISAGRHTTIGIDASTGLAYAWGYNVYGQLGDNSTTDRLVPTSVSSTISWKQIAPTCSGHHTIAIDSATGLAYGWGRNTYGGLGDNSRTNRSVPTSVSSTISWSAVIGGGYFTLGIDGATGLAYAWGANDFGNLGTGDRTSYSVPTSVSSTISWKQIAAANHTVGIDGATGLAYAWGGNTYGELGTGDLMSYSVPTSVSSTISWKQIICGLNHTIGIDAATGLAYGWGYNGYGELGTGDLMSYSVPTKMKTNVSWTQISSGFYHVVGIRNDQYEIYKINGVEVLEH